MEPILVQIYPCPQQELQCMPGRVGLPGTALILALSAFRLDWAAENFIFTHI